VKTDDNGVKQWDARFGGKKEDKLESLDQTSDGGYILGGVTESGIGADKTQPSQGKRDYWIVKTTAAGQIVCNAPTSLSAVNITATSAKLKWSDVGEAISYKIMYKVAGSSQWTTISSVNNQKLLTGLAPSSTYVWKVQSICGTLPLITSDGSSLANFTTLPFKFSEDAMNEMIKGNSFLVYPNPVLQSAIISFTLDEASPVVIEIMDVNGRSLEVVANQNFPAGNYEISFDQESPVAGIYFLQMKSKEGTLVRTIVIQ
jgi:hypothetical protein